MVDLIQINSGKDSSIVIVWTKLMGLRQNAASKKGYNMGMHSLQLLSVEVGIECSGTVLKSVGCVWM